MRRDVISMLISPRTRAPYDLDPIRVADDEIVEAFLVARADLEVRPLVAGVAVLPVDLDRHLRTQGSVYKRSPINDPRLARFLLGRAGDGYDIVPFEEVVGHYRDLAISPPEGYDTSTHPADEALARLLRDSLDGEARQGRGLVIGCGGGRSTFVLCVHLETVLGVDRSVACVRRSRNIAVTREHFFLPAPRDSGLKEIPIDLERIVRTGADFAVADAHALPLPDGVMDVVVLNPGDAGGGWDDTDAVTAEALRVVRPGGLFIRHEAIDGAGVRGLPPDGGRSGPWRAARVP